MRLGLGLGLVRLGKAIASFVRDGLKLYYPFRDNNPELLLSGATSFDGTDDYIDLGDSADWDFGTGDWSFAHWIKITEDDAGYSIWRGTGGTRKWGMFFDHNNDQFYYLKSNSSGAPGGQSVASGNNTAPINNWYHVAYTRSSGTGSIYINGSLMNTVSNDVQDHNYSDSLILGNAQSLFTSKLMANVGIWNRALSASEIESIYWRGQYADLKGTELTNLVSWYNLSADANDSTGTNNGTNNGATFLTDAYSASSPFLPRIQDKASDTVANYGEVYGGNAVSFDGSNDYIDTGTAFSNTNHTISTWVNASATGGAVFDNRDANDDGIRFLYDSNLTYQLNSSDITVSNPSLNTWHHIACTYDGTTQKLYLNGSLVASASTSQTVSVSQNLIIGKQSYSDVAYFNGSINNLKIFNTALTQDQVRELYTKPELTLPTGIASSALKLDMPMQEGSGIAILDGSPTFLDVAVNGDFSADAVGSTSVTGWSLDDFTAEVIADGYSGNAVQLTRVDSGTQSFYQDLSGITSGNKYKINVKLKAIGGSVSAGIRVTTPTNSNPSSNIVSLPADGSWEDVELSFTAQGTTARIQIQRQESDPGSIVVDDVIINQLNLGQNHGTGNGITWATGQEYGFQHSLVRSNNPMVFDGADDKVSVGTPSALNNIFTGGGTLSAWINPKSDGQNNAGQAFDKVKYAFQVISESSGSVKVQFAVTLSGGAARWETPLSVPLNTWTHILVTYDSDNPTTDPIIYLNGSAVTLTETISPSGTWVSDASSNLTLGNRNDGVTTFDGLLNDLAIWSSTLTANEVTALYNSGLPLLPTTDSGNYASSSDLVGYWRNDGVITWTDRSTNSNNGTVSGSPASIIVPEGLNEGRDSQGYYLTDTDSISSGIRFKGAEYISIEQSPSLNDISFSIEMWIKRSRIGVLEYVFKQGSQASANKRLHLGFNSGNKITFNFYSDDDVSSASIDNTNWNHIVWTFNSSNQLKTIYINGSSDSTATSDNNFTGDSLNTYLGTYNLSSFFFKGSIDEAKIYSKELSATEVLKNYNNGKSAHSN